MNKNKKILVTIVSIVIAVGAGVAIYYSVANNNVAYYNTHPAQQRIGNKSTTESNTAQPSSTANSSANDTTAKADAGSTSQTSGSLQTPFGQFVSNDDPAIGSYEESECETTPGATCYIEFTNSSGNTISLQKETANAQGVAAWGWYVSGAKGFSPGAWKLQAIATQNGQTKTADGSINVQQ